MSRFLRKILSSPKDSTRKTYFVSAPRNAHVDRFDKLFATSFANYEFVEIASPDFSDTAWTDDFRSKMEADARIISGPLDSVSSTLGPTGHTNIGISYAVDLMVACKNPQQFRSCQKYAVSADLLIVDTMAAANILAAMGVSSSRIFVGPWGVEEGFLGKLEANILAGTNEPSRILFPRSLESHYRPHLALEAFARFVQAGGVATLDFVGNGSLRKSLEEVVSSYNLESAVRFREFVGELHMPKLLADYDSVLNLPVTDGSSVTLLQAMAMGIPVISSRTAGAMEWIVDGITGLLLDGDSVEQVVDGLVRFVGMNSTERNQIRTNCRRLISERANWSTVSDELISRIRAISGDFVPANPGSQ